MAHLEWDDSTIFDQQQHPPTPGRNLQALSPKKQRDLSKVKKKLDLSIEGPKAERLEKKPTDPSKSSESKKMKVKAWANILKFKQKLYIPHRSSRTPDKENDCNNLNVEDVKPDTLSLLPPIILPQLLSPIRDVPDLFLS